VACKLLGEFCKTKAKIMAKTADSVNLTWSYSQSGRLVKFQTGIVRQKLTVTIAESAPAGKRELEEHQKRKMRNELHPTINMEFAVEKNEAIRCTEISMKGGEGFATVGLAALNSIGDPIEVGLDGIKTWLNVSAGSEWILVRPGDGTSTSLIPGAKPIDVSEARRVARTRDRDSELIEVARVDLANPENPNKAVELAFGAKEGTARNRRKAAIKRGLIPSGKLSPEERQQALERLNGFENKSEAEVKELLRKMKEGTAND
jgi:hypothetical protein